MRWLFPSTPSPTVADRRRHGSPIITSVYPRVVTGPTGKVDACSRWKVHRFVESVSNKADGQDAASKKAATGFSLNAWLLVGLAMVYYVIGVGLYSFTTVLLMDGYGMDNGVANQLASVPTWFNVLLGVPGGWAGVRWGQRLNLVTASCALWIVFAVLALFKSPAIIWLLVYGTACVAPRIFVWQLVPLVVRRANLGRAYAVLPAYGSVALGIFGIGLGFVYDRDAAVGGVLIIALMGFTAVVGLFCSLGLTRRTGRKLNARAFTAPTAKTALFGDLLGLNIDVNTK